MVKISLNESLEWDLKTFTEAFGDKFNHLPKKDRKRAIKAEFERLVPKSKRK